MSPIFAHSSKGEYLLPISHSNKFHIFCCITMSISMTVLDSVVTVNKLVVTVLDLVMKLVVVDTVIDLFVTVLDSLVED
jgi:hypothetical protein